MATEKGLWGGGGGGGGREIGKNGRKNNMIQSNNKIKKWKMARIRQNRIKREAERNILTQTAYGSSRNRIERNSYLLLDDVVPPHSFPDPCSF